MKNVYIVLAIFLFTTLSAQESSEKDSLVIQPFDLTELTTAAEGTDKILREVGDVFERDVTSNDIYQEYLAVLDKNKKLREDTVYTELSKYNLWSLTDISNNWSFYEKEIEGFKDDFSKLTDGYQEVYKMSQEYYQRWMLTKEKGMSEIPEPLLARINDMIDNLKIANTSLKDSLNLILTHYDIIAREHTNILDVKKLIQEITTDKRLNIFARDSQPLFNALRGEESEDGFATQIGGTLSSSYTKTLHYLKDNKSSSEFQLIIMILIIGLFFYLSHVFNKSKLDKDSIDPVAVFLINHPLRVGLTFSLFLSFWVYNDPPAHIGNTIMLLVILSFLLLLSGLVKKEIRNIFYFMTFLYILNYTENFMTSYPLSQRIMILIESVLLLFGLIYLIRPKSKIRDNNSSGWKQINSIIFPLYILLSVLAIYGNLTGSLYLARLLTKTMVISISVGAILLLIYIVVRSLLDLLIQSNARKFLRLIEFQGNLIRRKLLLYLRFFFYFLWMRTFLNQIGLLTYITEGFENFLEIGQNFGDVYLSVGQVFNFIFILFIFSLIANIVKDILSIEILPRLNMKKGVPMTTGILTRYVILVLGFLMAVAAAGISLDKLGFMAGALGVGIGFGLQNIVGNFVSGLILIFERPVRVDDVISSGTVEGTITDIGIRASKIRDYNGAEVIVPNMELISQQVTNWTLSDSKRRRELFIKVEYGSDPNQVKELILGVINAHQGVVDDSNALVLFLGFQEFSLDFRVLFWTTENMLVTTSDVAIGIYNVLKEAGINMPIPKREVIEVKEDAVVKKTKAKKPVVKPDEKS